MEAATKTIERMSESFAQSDAQDSFVDWAKRSAADSSKEAKETKDSRSSREIDLKERSPEEQEFIKSVGVKDESKDSEKESRRPRTEQHSDPKAGEKSNDSSSSPSENSEQGLKRFASDSAPEQLNTRMARDLESDLAEVAQAADKIPITPAMASFLQNVVLPMSENPGAIIRKLAAQPELVKRLHTMDHAGVLREIAKLDGKQAPPKPRAPKPPVDTGGRGAAGDDGTRSAEGFSDFSTRQSQRYGRR